MTQPPEGREIGEFDYAGKLTVKLFKPESGQALILLDVLDLGDENVADESKIETVNLFSQMLRSLFVEDSDRRAVRGMLARAEAGLDDFVSLAEQMTEHWMPDQAQNRAQRRAAAKDAPAATRRPAARKATARRPAAKKAAPRGGAA